MYTSRGIGGKKTHQSKTNQYVKVGAEEQRLMEDRDFSLRAIGMCVIEPSILATKGDERIKKRI